MDRDTIQLETAVSTISQEYLLEFTSEYGISKDLHPELPGPEERIVDFPENMNLFNLVSAPNPSKVKTGLRLRATHEVLLLMATAIRVIDIEDPDVATESFGTSSAIEKSPLDFNNENPSPPITKGAASEVSLEEEVAAMGPRLSKKRHKRVNDRADANAPPKVLRKDYASVLPEQSTHGGKTLPTMRLAADSTFVTPADTKGVSDPDPLSYAKPQPHPKQSMTHVGSGKSNSSPSMVMSPGGIYQSGWGVTNNCRLDTPDACQDVVDDIVSMGSQLRQHFEQEVRLLKKDRAQIVRRDQRIQVREEEIKKLDQEVHGLQNQTSNLKTLLEAEADMKKAAEAKNADLTKELESLRTQFLDLQVSNDQLTQQKSTLQTQVIGEERIKAAFEEFKKYKDDRVEKRCAEMDARLDALNIDFDEELYPHMLIAIVGMSEGLAHGIEHGKAGRDLEVVEAYDPEANIKYLQALQGLKDLKYLIVDQLEGLKDASMEAVKEEMLLEEAIAANVSRVEKKKRCRVGCRTHGVGFVHYARSDGVPVSVPTVAPQGLAILLADAATQTNTSEDDASPRLLRTKSLPPMYNLD
uniref:Transposase (Putative), gypsy type n=1 Tax=Tanacetum cinerariifolium TaxID=118510 RepID=A0A699IHR3_TANCI|nr:hypothetical protein [Tanacetum cinerariifolium]